MCKGLSCVWNSHGGDWKTSLSGAETTGPRTSRGPDSTLLLSFSPRSRLSFSSFFSLSLFQPPPRVSLLSESSCEQRRVLLTIFCLWLLAIGPLDGWLDYPTWPIRDTPP